MLDPIRSSGVGLYAPGLDIITGHSAARAIKAIDPDLVVVFDRKIQRFVVYDSASPGGPKWQMVMRVQEPDGSFRPLDGRTVQTIREMRHRYETTDPGKRLDAIVREAAEAYDAQDRDWAKRNEDFAHSAALDLKWFSRAVVPSVAWRERTDPAKREAIRQLAA